MARDVDHPSLANSPHRAGPRQASSTSRAAKKQPQHVLANKENAPVTKTSNDVPRSFAAIEAASGAGRRKSSRVADVTTNFAVPEDETLLGDIAPPSDLAGPSASSLFGSDDIDPAPQPASHFVGPRGLARPGRGVSGGGGLLTPEGSLQLTKVQQVEQAQSHAQLPGRRVTLQPTPSASQGRIESLATSRSRRSLQKQSYRESEDREDDEPTPRPLRKRASDTQPALPPSQRAWPTALSSVTPAFVRHGKVPATAPRAVVAAEARLRASTPVPRARRRSTAAADFTPAMQNRTQTWLAGLTPKQRALIPKDVHYGRVEAPMDVEPGDDPLLLEEPGAKRRRKELERRRSTIKKRRISKGLPKPRESAAADDTFANQVQRRKARQTRTAASSRLRHSVVPDAPAETGVLEDEEAPANLDSPFVPRTLTRLAGLTKPSSPPAPSPEEDEAEGVDFGDYLDFHADMPSDSGSERELTPGPADRYDALSHLSPSPTPQRTTVSDSTMLSTPHPSQLHEGETIFASERTRTAVAEALAARMAEDDDSGEADLEDDSMTELEKGLDAELDAQDVDESAELSGAGTRTEEAKDDEPEEEPLVETYRSPSPPAAEDPEFEETAVSPTVHGIPSAHLANSPPRLLKAPDAPEETEVLEEPEEPKELEEEDDDDALLADPEEPEEPEGDDDDDALPVEPDVHRISSPAAAIEQPVQYASSPTPLRSSQEPETHRFSPVEARDGPAHPSSPPPHSLLSQEQELSDIDPEGDTVLVETTEVDIEVEVVIEEEFDFEGDTREELDAEGDRREELDFEGDTREELDAEGDTREELDAEGDTREELDFEGDTREELGAESDMREDIEPADNSLENVPSHLFSPARRIFSPVGALFDPGPSSASSASPRRGLPISPRLFGPGGGTKNEEIAHEGYMRDDEDIDAEGDTGAEENIDSEGDTREEIHVDDIKSEEDFESCGIMDDISTSQASARPLLHPYLSPTPEDLDTSAPTEPAGEEEEAAQEEVEKEGSLHEVVDAYNRTLGASPESLSAQQRTLQPSSPQVPAPRSFPPGEDPDERAERQARIQQRVLYGLESPSQRPAPEVDLDVPARQRRRQFAGSTPAKPRLSGSLEDIEPPTPGPSQVLEGGSQSVSPDAPPPQARSPMRSPPDTSPQESPDSSPPHMHTHLRASPLKAPAVHGGSPIPLSPLRSPARGVPSAATASLSVSAVISPLQTKGKGRVDPSPVRSQHSPARVLAYDSDTRRHFEERPTPEPSLPSSSRAATPVSQVSTSTHTSPPKELSHTSQTPGMEILRVRTPRSMTREFRAGLPISPLADSSKRLGDMFVQMRTGGRYVSPVKAASPSPTPRRRSPGPHQEALRPSPSPPQEDISGDTTHDADPSAWDDTVDVEGPTLDGDRDVWGNDTIDITQEMDDSMGGYRYDGAEWDVTRIEQRERSEPARRQSVVPAIEEEEEPPRPPVVRVTPAPEDEDGSMSIRGELTPRTGHASPRFTQGSPGSSVGLTPAPRSPSAHLTPQPGPTSLTPRQHVRSSSVHLTPTPQVSRSALLHLTPQPAHRSPSGHGTPMQPAHRSPSNHLTPTQAKSGSLASRTHLTPTQPPQSPAYSQHITPTQSGRSPQFSNKHPTPTPQCRSPLHLPATSLTPRSEVRSGSHCSASEQRTPSLKLPTPRSHLDTPAVDHRSAQLPPSPLAARTPVPTSVGSPRASSVVSEAERTLRPPPMFLQPSVSSQPKHSVSIEDVEDVEGPLPLELRRSPARPASVQSLRRSPRLSRAHSVAEEPVPSLHRSTRPSRSPAAPREEAIQSSPESPVVAEVASPRRSPRLSRTAIPLEAQPVEAARSPRRSTCHSRSSTPVEAQPTPLRVPTPFTATQAATPSPLRRAETRNWPHLDPARQKWAHEVDAPLPVPVMEQPHVQLELAQLPRVMREGQLRQPLAPISAPRGQPATPVVEPSRAPALDIGPSHQRLSRVSPERGPARERYHIPEHCRHQGHITIVVHERVIDVIHVKDESDDDDDEPDVIQLENSSDDGFGQRVKEERLPEEQGEEEDLEEQEHLEGEHHLPRVGVYHEEEDDLQPMDGSEGMAYEEEEDSRMSYAEEGNTGMDDWLENGQRMDERMDDSLENDNSRMEYNDSDKENEPYDEMIVVPMDELCGSTDVSSDTDGEHDTRVEDVHDAQSEHDEIEHDEYQHGPEDQDEAEHEDGGENEADSSLPAHNDVPHATTLGLTSEPPAHRTPMALPQRQIPGSRSSAPSPGTPGGLAPSHGRTPSQLRTPCGSTGAPADRGLDHNRTPSATPRSSTVSQARTPSGNARTPGQPRTPSGSARGPDERTAGHARTLSGQVRIPSTCSPTVSFNLQPQFALGTGQLAGDSGALSLLDSATKALEILRQMGSPEAARPTQSTTPRVPPPTFPSGSDISISSTPLQPPPAFRGQSTTPIIPQGPRLPPVSTTPQVPPPHHLFTAPPQPAPQPALRPALRPVTQPAPWSARAALQERPAGATEAGPSLPSRRTGDAPTRNFEPNTVDQLHRHALPAGTGHSITPAEPRIEPRRDPQRNPLVHEGNQPPSVSEPYRPVRPSGLSHEVLPSAESTPESRGNFPESHRLLEVTARSLHDELEHTRRSHPEPNRRNLPDTVEDQHTPRRADTRHFDSPTPPVPGGWSELPRIRPDSTPRLTDSQRTQPRSPRRVGRGPRPWTISDWRRLEAFYNEERSRAATWTPFTRSRQWSVSRVVDNYISRLRIEDRELVGEWSHEDLEIRVRALDDRAEYRERSRSLRRSKLPNRTLEEPPSTLRRVVDWAIGRSTTAPAPRPRDAPRQRERNDPESGFLFRMDESFDADVTMAPTPSQPRVGRRRQREPEPGREFEWSNEYESEQPTVHHQQEQQDVSTRERYQPLSRSPRARQHPRDLANIDRAVSEHRRRSDHNYANPLNADTTYGNDHEDRSPSPQPTEIEDDEYRYNESSPRLYNLYPTLPDRSAALAQAVRPRVIEGSPRPAARPRSLTLPTSPLAELRRSTRARLSVAQAARAFTTHASADLSYESKRRARERDSLADPGYGA
ncbi:hypothetical protein CspeluHIS016_0702830 [Cutaneotrichosporon spelunceum]|uniref:Uncharacterized protein n=1 Tax=Cutaneotrichosporon spelunceum TaxID=1672016 RepID=A0AAD3TYT5_9TREE|nr:hypothetical protein CspeluHIS016_0702830 [Cutaneotrichosporon spelunceum]